METTVYPQLSPERALARLRGLFESYGYSRYRVSKFEEYDLYAQNRSFITGSSILTFTDTDGRLMALKPDVTLSIIRNTKPAESLSKLYYHESVYRAADAASGFAEIRQTGLECIGALDLYCMCEVLTLAEESLAALSPRYILDVSHMGLLSGFLEDAGATRGCRETLLRLAEEKNSHEAAQAAAQYGLSQEQIETFQSLIHLRVRLSEAEKALSALPLGETARRAVAELGELAGALGAGENVYLDLSLQCDPRYYNGVVFKGFLPGVPCAVLSGGRYDGLTRRLGRSSGAMGFAVYLNLLDGWNRELTGLDADILVLDEGADAGALLAAVRSLTASGQRVRVDRAIPEGFRYGRLLRMGKEGTVHG